MVYKVLKTNDFVKKIEWQRKTYPLKLNLTDEQKQELDFLTSEYKKCINACIEIIRKKVFPKYKKLEEGKWIVEFCPLCKAKSKQLKYVLEDFVFEPYYIKKRLYYKAIYKKGKKTKVCDCIGGKSATPHKSLRKLVKPSRNYTIRPEYDYTIFGKLTSKKLVAGEGSRTTIYDACLQKAVETIKSQLEIQKRLRRRITFFEGRIIQIKNFIEGKVDDEKLKKYNKKRLKSFITRNKNMIKKLEKRFTEKIEYKQNTIRLYNNSYNLEKEKDDFYINLKNYSNNKWMKIKFFGEKYQKKLALKFIKSDKAETEILKKGKNYYLQYIYRQETEVPIPDETFTAVGLDVGILNLACQVFLKKDRKPFDTRFFSGRFIRRRRRQYDKIRRIWQKRKRLNKVKNSKGKERDYLRYQIHKLTTKIVLDIKDGLDKPVIVLENLKNINDKIKKMNQNCTKILKKLKGSSRKYYIAKRRLNLEFKKWNFADFQKFIEYKANWLGIPVVYVPAKDTSIMCNKCGNVDVKNYTESEDLKALHELKFKCIKCGYMSNADFNAGVNIARAFYEGLKNKQNEN